MIGELMPWRKKENAVAKAANTGHFDELNRQMNELFEDFFDDFGKHSLISEKHGRDFMFSPHFDVAETENSIEVSAELAGMDEKDIDVSLDNNVLTIKGEKKEEKEEKKKDYHVSERCYGSFQRSFSLPDGLDEAGIKAKFSKGILHIALPKSEKTKSKSKKIQVKTE